MITGKEYYKITGSSGNIKLPEFTVEEVQEFLTSTGYIIEVHVALAKTINYTYNMAGGTESQYETLEEVSRILARMPTQQLPKRNDSQEAKDMDFREVFRRQMKARLLK